MVNSTSMTLNSTNNSAEWLLQASLWSLRILCPIFMILCPIFNWACIQIFQSRVYARSSSKWYFIFIAIFDTIYVLVTGTLLFLITLNIYILNWNVFLCKSIVFFNYLSCQISAGLLACLSIDRLIATWCLYMYRHTCTTHLSRIVCLVVIFVISIINSHYLIGYTIDSNGLCNAKRYKWYDANYARFNVVYLLSYSIIPFTIITICNLLIVLSVCQNKTNMRKKYEMKKTVLCSTNSHAAQIILAKYTLRISDKPVQISEFNHDSNAQSSKDENKYEMLASIQDEKVISSVLDSKSDWQQPPRTNRLCQNLLLHGDEQSNNSTSNSSTLIEQKSLNLSPPRRRSVTNVVSSSPTNSQKMCVQLQITISLLAVSICFIFCTLPNCISTIMIQTYTNDEHARQFWQAMNFFSIVPLLMTHSVNLIFYYLSSNMFRERFQEYYLKKKT